MTVKLFFSDSPLWRLSDFSGISSSLSPSMLWMEVQLALFCTTFFVSEVMWFMPSVTALLIELYGINSTLEAGVILICICDLALTFSDLALLKLCPLRIDDHTLPKREWFLCNINHFQDVFKIR